MTGLDRPELRNHDLQISLLFSKLAFSLTYGVFQDIFWRLKTKHPEKVVVSCPDVMFYKYSREIPDENYVDLTRKWNVKKWVVSSGRVRWYGCRHGYSHTSPGNCDSFQSGMAVPPCDLENLADAVKFVMKECENAGLLCELTDGTLTGKIVFQHFFLPSQIERGLFKNRIQ